MNEIPDAVESFDEDEPTIVDESPMFLPAFTLFGIGIPPRRPRALSPCSRLVAYLDGLMEDSEASFFRRHAVGCISCTIGAQSLERARREP